MADRLFACDIQHSVLVGDGTAELQQHGGFAHARLTTQQHDAAQHDAAAQHTVKLGDASQNAALLLGGADVSQPLCGQRSDALLTDRGSRLAAGKAGFGCLSDHILVHSIPAAAARAAAHPAGACLSAIGADIYGFQFRFFHSGLSNVVLFALLLYTCIIIPHPARSRKKTSRLSGLHQTICEAHKPGGCAAEWAEADSQQGKLSYQKLCPCGMGNATPLPASPEGKGVDAAADL